jgi:hypothetical protein
LFWFVQNLSFHFVEFLCFLLLRTNFESFFERSRSGW